MRRLFDGVLDRFEILVLGFIFIFLGMLSPKQAAEMIYNSVKKADGILKNRVGNNG
jgi:hypothetical protein